MHTRTPFKSIRRHVRQVVIREMCTEIEILIVTRLATAVELFVANGNGYDPVGVGMIYFMSVKISK